MELDTAMFTDKGEREINEDSIDLIRAGDTVCAVLCDGLGGHEGGEVASALVCASIRREVENAAEDEDLTALINRAVQTAQEDLLAEQRKRMKFSDMKTTLCCLMLRGEEFAAAYIGDSRIYHFRKNKLLKRTLDHSVPQFLVNSGEIKEKHIRRHPDRNKLLRVMGTEWDEPRYQMFKMEKPAAGDSFFLCSDGFWDWIDERGMQKRLRASRSAEHWIELMRQDVLKNGQGKGMDNYSAVVIKINR